MAPEGKAAAHNTDAGKKRKRYLPHNKPVKKKGSYPLRPGVQGFFITCDGGREHQASREALNILESFYEELVHGENSDAKELPKKPLNTKITFVDSDTSGSDDDDDEEEEEVVQEGDEENGDKKHKTDDVSNDDNAGNGNGAGEKSDAAPKSDDVNADAVDKANEDKGDIESKADEILAMKQCSKTEVPTTCDSNDKVEHKSIDRLIEAELEELGDKNKRRFVKLDSGCNGVVFVQMRKKDGDKSPNDIVHKIVTSAASTRKHMSRFILRILPIEVACYASKDEISRAIKPLVERYFPEETQNPHKFAVLYEARANTGVDRMEIINAVAQSIPKPHKVDLNNPDKTIVVEIARTVCLIGVIEKYKELSKYNLRQLTSQIGFWRGRDGNCNERYLWGPLRDGLMVFRAGEQGRRLLRLRPLRPCALRLQGTGKVPEPSSVVRSPPPQGVSSFAPEASAFKMNNRSLIDPDFPLADFIDGAIATGPFRRWVEAQDQHSLLHETTHHLLRAVGLIHIHGEALAQIPSLKARVVKLEKERATLEGLYKKKDETSKALGRECRVAASRS